MKATKTRHFNYQTPLDEAQSDDELKQIFRLKWPKVSSNLKIDAMAFGRMIDEARATEAWRVVGFKSFGEFCEAELNKTLDEVETICQGVRRLESRGATECTEEEAVQAALESAPLGPGQGKRTDLQPLATSTKLKRGSCNASYLAARIKRDHPDIAKRIKEGEFKSVRAAAIAAGIVKPTWQATQDPQGVYRLYLKLSATEQHQFKTMIGN